MNFEVSFQMPNGELVKIRDFTEFETDRLIHVLRGYFDYADVGETVVIKVKESYVEE